MAKSAVIILAAGSSVRFGSPKQLVELEGKNLVQTAIDEANDSNADYVLLVLGNSSSEILEKVNLGRAQLLFNKYFEQGIASSIKSGITNIPDDCSSAIIMVADQPFLRSNHLNALIQESRKSPGKIVALAYKGEPRNPVLIPKELFAKLEELKGDEGARSLVRSELGTVFIEIPDARVFSDVDTKDSLVNLQKDGAR